MTSFKKIILDYLRAHDIKVLKWTNIDYTEGIWEADIMYKEVIIPNPNTELEFLICLHEIGHCVRGDSKLSHIREYYAERYAIDEADKHGILNTEYIEQAKQYIHNCIAYDIQEGLISSIEEVDKDILNWINENKAMYSMR